MSSEDRKFVPYHCTHSGQSKQDFLAPKRQVFIKGEVLMSVAPEDTNASKAETQKPPEAKEEEHRIPGVPIDVDPSSEEGRKLAAEYEARLAREKAAKEAREKAEREEKERLEAERLKIEAGIEAKKQLNEAEQKIVAKFGGEVYDMNTVADSKEKGNGSQVYINKPKDASRFLDEQGKPIPPKIVYFFHGKDGGIADAERMMRQIEERRAKGENVILVMPQNTSGDWKDLEHKEAFRDIHRLAEQVAGAKSVDDIETVSFGDGKKAVEKVKARLKEASDTDPEAKVLLERISARVTELAEADLKIPERAPDALGGKAFFEVFMRCKSPDERTKLVLEQIAKGNVPAHYRTFENVTVQRGGHTMQFKAARHALCFGTDDDYVEVPVDGQTAKAVADAIGCSIPTSWHVERIEEEARLNGDMIPFYGQQNFAAELDLNPKIVHSDKMQTALFLAKHREMVERWAAAHGVSMRKLTAGYYKDVVLPEPGVTSAGQLEIFGGIDLAKKRAQKLSGGVHPVGYFDYSHRFRPISGNVTVDGVAMTEAEAMSDANLGRIFGYAPRDIGTAYPYGESTREYVARIQAQTPASTSVVREEAPPAPPAEEPAVVAVAEEKPEETTALPTQPEPTSTVTAQESTPATAAGPTKIEAPSTGPYPAAAQPVSYVPEQPAPAEQPVPAMEQPAPIQQPAQIIQPAPVEIPRQHVEVTATGKTFVIGDSLAEGFTRSLRGSDATLIQPAGKENSVGQSTQEMLATLRTQLLSRDVQGHTLLIVGGTNDIFLPDSLPKIQQNLAEIYRLAKEKGMHVIGATIPPLASSDYAKRWARQTKTPYEQYNAELITRWRQLNEWIRAQKGENGPDEIVEFDTALEDPASPGSLKPEYRGEGGIHLNNYEPMAALIRERLPSGNDSASAPAENGFQSEEGKSHMAENHGIRGKVPAGFGQVRGRVPAEASAKASELLASTQFGEVTPFEASGKQYVGVKEWHYHEPGGPAKPWGWHEGVTVLERKSSDDNPDEQKEAVA